MSSTDKLEHILDHLHGKKPNVGKAVSIVKELLVKGPCTSDIAAAKKVTGQILTELVKPALGDDRDRTVALDHLVNKIKKSSHFKADNIIKAIDEMAGWIASPAAKSAIRFPLENLLNRLLESLQVMGEGQEWIIEEVAKLTKRADKGVDTAYVKDVYALLSRITTSSEISQVGWEQEREELKKLIITLADSFGAVLESTGDVDEELAGILERIKKSDDIVDLTDLKTALTREANLFQRQASAISSRLRVSQNLLKKSRERIEKMENALQDAKEDNLVDPFTGLPNRFAFAVRLSKEVKRSTTLNEQFCLGLLELNDLDTINEEHGREMGAKLLRSISKRLQDELSADDYLARIAENRLIILFSKSGVSQVVKRCSSISDILGRLRFKLDGVQIQVPCAIGITASRAGLTPKELLKAAGDALLAAWESADKTALLIAPAADQ